MFKTREAANAWQRQWNKNNPEKVKAVQKKYRDTHKQQESDRHRKRKFGIPAERYKEMSEQQANKCAICRKLETEVDTRTGTVRSLAVDHDHHTDKLRSLLCRRCNAGLGMFYEDVELMSKAIKYLEEWNVRNS